MKLAVHDTEFKAFGVQSETEYSVANSPKMMEILSNSLYSDKITAVIRELSMNAIESHQDAKQTRKYDVHLPTHKEQFFKIRDYGTGLSEQKLRKLYTTYGLSTKDQSNDYTGCLGLGSKSPFAYVSEFTTISYYNGQKITAINTKNEAGIPSFIIMSIEPTAEPNGLEVSFESDNQWDFKLKATNLYQYFDEAYRPNLNIELPYSNIKFEIDGQDWKYGKCKDSYSSAISYAVMGQIAYRINTSSFTGEYKNILNNGCDLYFEIGELDITPSREDLQYTEKTVNAIKSKLADIEIAVVERFNEEIRSCDCYWNACIKAKTLKNARIYQNLNLGNLKWNARPIKAKVNLDGIAVTHYYKRYHRNREETTSVIEISESSRIYYEDGKGTKSTVRKLRSDGFDVYLIQKDKADEVAELVGLPEIKSILTKKEPRGPIVRSKPTYFYKFDSSTRRENRAEYWDKCSAVPDSGVYIQIENNLINGSTHPTKLYEYLSNTGKQIEVHGITKSKVKLVENNPKWKHLFDVLTEELRGLATADYMFYINNRAKISDLDYYPYSKIRSKLDKLTPKSIFHEVFKFVPTKDNKNKFEKLESALANYLMLTKKEFKCPESKDKLPEYEDVYPLLKYLDRATADEIVNYINMVEGV